MQRLVAGLAAAALALGAATASALPAAAAADRVTVKGHVTSPTGKPVAGVQVSVYSVREGHRVVVRDRTSRTGRYAVSVLDSDWEYLVKVTDHGDADRDDGDGTWAPVLDTFTRHGVRSIRHDVVVHRGAGVSGRILDRSGKPVKAGLPVSASVGRLGSSTRTRADGTYRITNLPAGDAIISAQSPGGWGRARTYSATTRAGVTDAGRATPVPVTAGKVVTGIGIAFPKVGKITGRVTVDGEQPWSEGADGVDAVLLDAAGHEVARWWAHPSFRIWDVEPGVYTLRFTSPASVTDPVVPEYYRDAATPEAAERLVVRPGTAITGLVAELRTE